MHSKTKWHGHCTLEPEAVYRSSEAVCLHCLPRFPVAPRRANKEPAWTPGYPRYATEEAKANPTLTFISRTSTSGLIWMLTSKGNTVNKCSLPQAASAAQQRKHGEGLVSYNKSINSGQECVKEKMSLAASKIDNPSLNKISKNKTRADSNI